MDKSKKNQKNKPLNNSAKANTDKKIKSKKADKKIPNKKANEKSQNKNINKESINKKSNEKANKENLNKKSNEKANKESFNKKSNEKANKESINKKSNEKANKESFYKKANKENQNRNANEDSLNKSTIKGSLKKTTKINALKKQISSSALTAPLLMLSVMLLLWGSEFYVKRAVSADENVFLSLCIVQIIAFFAPSLLYYQIKHRKLSTSLLVSPLKMSHGVFIVFASLLFFTGQILLKYFMFKFLGITTESSAIQLGEDVPIIQPILAFCVVPAVCEEFFFRGIILSEYRSHGLFKAVIISSVFFAFSHFSFTGFPIYLFAGIMLSVLTAVSRSVFPGMILHFANNLLDLYAGDFLNELSWLDSDMYFFRFVLVLLFLISLWRVFSRMQHIYFQYSENPPKEALGGVKPKAKGAFRSWTLLLPICAYLIITAITS